MLDGQLRGVGVRGCMGEFFIFVGQAFFHEKGFLGLCVVERSSGYWDVESVSWTGYSIGFCSVATVGRTVRIECGLHAAHGLDWARISQGSEFTVDGGRRLTWYADRSADLSGMKNPRLERLSCGSLWSVTREIDCTICVMADHMTILNVQHWSARTMQVRNECPSTEL